MSLSYAETLSIAEGTCRLIAPYCKATQIVGSLARELDFSDPRTSENIDILVVPNPELFPFISFQHYKKEVLNLTGVEFFPHTQWFALMTFVRESIKIRIFTATESDFGVATLIFTGSNNFNLTLIDRAKRLGLTFNTDEKGIWGIWNKSRELLTDGTEESVFSALSIKFIPKNKRSLFEKDPSILEAL